MGADPGPVHHGVEALNADLVLAHHGDALVDADPGPVHHGVEALDADQSLLEKKILSA